MDWFIGNQGTNSETASATTSVGGSVRIERHKNGYVYIAVKSGFREPLSIIIEDIQKAIIPIRSDVTTFYPAGLSGFPLSRE